MDCIPWGILPLVSISAIVLHEFVLRQMEVDRLALSLIVTSNVVYWILVYQTGLLSATVVAISFWIPLWLYIGCYRIFFHPLNGYPGPFGAKLSRWWALQQTWSSGLRFHRVQQKLQRQYGDYVRTGPRELSIFDPAAIQAVLGFQSKTTKGPFYDVMEKSLHLNRDENFHRHRRRIWDNAMKRSLSDYAPQIENFTDLLLTRIHAEEGRLLPLLDYMTYYSYDVMAQLAFGVSTSFVEGRSDGVAERVLNTLTNALDAFGYMYHMPWLMNTLGVLTSLVGPMKEWNDWNVEQMKARIIVKNSKPDLVSHLISATPKTAPGRELLYGESRLIISAGSETTSSALTLIFIHLALHKLYMHAVRKEYRETAATYHCQRPRTVLDSVIHESMRLWPSVLFASQRVTPPEGLIINGHYIPGNMIIQLPPFPMNRDPRNFVQPDQFIPERWTSRPDLVLNKTAYYPFSTGRYNCVGKPLAMMELRSVVSRVVNDFDIELPDSFDEESYWNGIKDHFTAGLPRQYVRLVRAK